MENLKSLLSYGNSKLPKSTAIFNLGSASHCPSAKLGLCLLADKCYALKAERQYPACLPYRERQRAYFSEATPEQFVAEFLAAVSRKQTTVKQLRVNESGDFNSVEDIDKLERIAKLLKPHNIRVYAYSARKDLAGYFARCEALVVNGSNFMGTNSFKGVVNASMLVADAKKIGLKDVVLCGGDCKKCNTCAVAKNKTILCEIH